MRVHGRRAVLVAILALAIPTLLFGQFRGIGRITGTVTDDAGAPIKGVAIRATKEGADGAIEATSDAKGEWAVNGMAKGEWHVTFQAAGYTPAGAKVNLVAEFGKVPPIGVVLKKSK